MTDAAALVRAAREQLAAAGISGPDAELLFAAASGLSLGEARLAVALARSTDRAVVQTFTSFVVRRLAREPLQHILGTAPFRSLELNVGPGVFVPRPETELLVDIALAFAREHEAARVLDVGTGSGAVAISIATELPTSRVTALERSPSAYSWARRNIAANDADVELVFGDFVSLAIATIGGPFDVLVSNPPYIPAAELPRDAEVLLHDPDAALFAGEDGLDLIRHLVARGRSLVVPGGGIALEHTEEQGGAVRELLIAAGWVEAITHQDLTARDRVTSARRPR